MYTEFQEAFDHMCDFRDDAPFLFAIPTLTPEMFRRITAIDLPVELVVPDLESFAVPEEDNERIQWAVDAAELPEGLLDSLARS